MSGRRRRFQSGDRGDELSVLNGGVCKADNADTAARADLSVLRTVGGFVDDIDKGFGPGLEVDQGLPAMLPERSRTRTISVGWLLMSGEAASASVTLREPEQSIWSVLMILLELLRPIVLCSPSAYWGRAALHHSMQAAGGRCVPRTRKTAPLEGAVFL